MSAPAPRPIAPLWARIPIGAGLGLLVHCAVEALPLAPDTIELVILPLAYAPLAALLCASREPRLSREALAAYLGAWLLPCVVVLPAAAAHPKPSLSTAMLIAMVALGGGVCAVRATGPLRSRSDASRAATRFLGGAVVMPLLAWGLGLLQMPLMIRFFGYQSLYGLQGAAPPDPAIFGSWVALGVAAALVLAHDAVAWLARKSAAAAEEVARDPTGWADE